LRLLKTFVRTPGLQLGNIIFVNDEGDDSTLSDDQVRELKAVTSFLNHNQNWYGPTAVAGHFDITATTRDDFLLFIADHDDLENNPILPNDDLMMSSYEMRTRVQDNNNNNNSNNNNRTGNNSRSSRSASPTARHAINHVLAQWLKKKKPITDYTMSLDDALQWSEWDRQLRALAYTHGVEDVLNHLYSPVPGSDEEELFEEMQKHMYTVFVRLVKETKGLQIVKKHKDDRDAQTIYKELYDHYAGEASQMAIANLDEMETSIMTAEIPDPRRLPLISYMENWKLKLDDFNNLADDDRFMNDAQTLVHLKSFIKNVPELQSINNMVTVMTTALLGSGRKPTASDKIQMYFNVATTVDKGIKAANRGRRGTSSRNIHLTEILGEDDEGYDDDVPLLENNAHEGIPDAGGIVEEEIDVDMLQAFATIFRGLKMNQATWNRLSPEAQQLWDQLAQRDKNTILGSRSGMSPSPRRSTPQDTPSNARPSPRTSPRPSALRNPPNQQQVAFHETPDSVPTIDQQYETNFLERSNYNVNSATQLATDTTVALSNDMYYTPTPSEECSIFKTITTVPKVTTPNDKSSSAGTGENSGSSDKKSLFRRMPKLRTRMAVVTNSRPWNRPWSEVLGEEYDLIATRIYLPHQYSDWHSRNWHPRIPREIRHRVTVGSGENASRVDILEWRSRMQGTVPTMTVPAEVISHGVSMMMAGDREEVDPWVGMRETNGTGGADGEPTNEGVGELLHGNEDGEEDNGEGDNMTRMSTVDGGNNRGVSGPGMRLLSYVSPERRVDLWGFQGRVVSNILIGRFGSIIRLNTDEEVLAIFSEYVHDPESQVHAIHSTLQLTDQGMNVEDRSPRFGTPPSITTLEGDVIPLIFNDGLPTLRLRYPTDTELTNMKRVYLTGSDVWNPSKYDRPSNIPSICITPSSAVNGPAALQPRDDESGDTSATEECDSMDDTVDTDNIDDPPKTTGQVSEELMTYKEAVRNQFKEVLKEVREVSMRGDIEGRLIAVAFGDDYLNGEYRTLPPWQAPLRDDNGNIVHLPSGGNRTYVGSWTTFLLRNESLITQARSDEIAHRLNAHQLFTGRAGNPKTKLNQRIRQLAFQHNMVKHLTMIIKSPWHGYTQDNTRISDRTLVLHPTLVEFMRIHGLGSRIIAEGIMFGDSDRFATMKIDMFGQMSNMSYVGPSFICPDDVLDEFEIGKT